MTRREWDAARYAKQRQDPEWRAQNRARVKAWYEANTEHATATRAAYVKAHKEETRAYQAGYRKQNADELKAAKSQWQKASRERCNERNREWTRANRQKARANSARYSIAKYRSLSIEARKAIYAEKKAYYDAWRIANPGIRRAAESRRRARMFAAPIGDTRAIARWETHWRTADLIACNWCENLFEPTSCHSDHVIPLSRGGAHSLENLVVACAPCNIRKGAKLPHEWRGGELV